MFGFGWETLTAPARGRVSPVERFDAEGVSRVNADLAEAPLANHRGRSLEVARWPGGRRPADLPGRLREGQAVSAAAGHPRRSDGRLHAELHRRAGPVPDRDVRRARLCWCCGPIRAAAAATAASSATPTTATGAAAISRTSWPASITSSPGAVADADRLGVMGWSYGGYMTSWTITQTKRFKAASVGAGVTNLMSFTGTADIPGFLPDYFGGEPWDKLDAYRAHSAMFQVKGVTHADPDPARRARRARAALAGPGILQRPETAGLHRRKWSSIRERRTASRSRSSWWIACTATCSGSTSTCAASECRGVSHDNRPPARAVDPRGSHAAVAIVREVKQLAPTFPLRDGQPERAAREVVARFGRARRCRARPSSSCSTTPPAAATRPSWI